MTRGGKREGALYLVVGTIPGLVGSRLVRLPGGAFADARALSAALRGAGVRFAPWRVVRFDVEGEVVTLWAAKSRGCKLATVTPWDDAREAARQAEFEAAYQAHESAYFHGGEQCPGCETCRSGGR